MKIRLVTGITLIAALCVLAVQESDAAGRQNRKGTGTCLNSGTTQASACSGSGTCSMTPSELDANEIARLKYMYEEEKLAGDVYAYAFSKWNLTVFSRIAASENKHEQAMLRQLALHEIDSSDLEARPAGSFVNSELQALYNSLITQVDVSQTEALHTGVVIEQQDIADLEEAIAETDAPELDRAYSNLMSASERHLSAFTRQSNLGTVCPDCAAGMKRQKRQGRSAARKGLR